MLCREELILWCERTVDLADIEDSPVGAGCQIHILGQVGEGHQRLALRESRERPFRDTEDTQSRQCQASLEHFPTRALIGHVRLLSHSDSLFGQSWRE